jgi:hypothetical protein
VLFLRIPSLSNGPLDCSLPSHHQIESIPETKKKVRKMIKAVQLSAGCAFMPGASRHILCAAETLNGSHRRPLRTMIAVQQNDSFALVSQHQSNRRLQLQKHGNDLKREA